MNTIAFNAAGPLNQEQLNRLEKFKGPPSNLVVVDAGRSPEDPNQLWVELDSPGTGAVPRKPAEGLSVSDLPETLRRSVQESVWSKRAGRKGLSPARPANSIRILCIHGIGHGDQDPNLRTDWMAAITAQLRRANPLLQPEFDFLVYDRLFDLEPHNVFTYGEAFLRLGWSGLSSSVAGLLGARGTMSDSLRWTAGMVAQWAENSELRQRPESLSRNASEHSIRTPLLHIAWAV